MRLPDLESAENKVRATVESATSSVLTRAEYVAMFETLGFDAGSLSWVRFEAHGITGELVHGAHKIGFFIPVAD